MVKKTRDKIGPIPLEDLELPDFTDLDLDRAYSPGLTQRINALIQSRKPKPTVDNVPSRVDDEKSSRGPDKSCLSLKSAPAVTGTHRPT